jgi:hypothetical protein
MNSLSDLSQGGSNMIPKLKEKELHNNQHCNPGENSGNRQQPSITKNWTSSGNEAGLTKQYSYPDAEWRRSKSARFQQN